MSINLFDFMVEPSAYDESFVYPESNYVYHLFFVKVPDNWTLPVHRVYVLAAVSQNANNYSSVLRAFDEDFAVTHLEDIFADIRTILRNAPEFNVHAEFGDVFPTSLARDDKFKASKISVDLGQQIEQISLVAIKDDRGGDWSGEGFFYSIIDGQSYNNSEAFIYAKQALRKKLKGETPMFARGALYQWALLSVAGVLDSRDPSKILPGKSFSLIDGWTGHLKLTPDNIEYLESLATDDESKAAVAKMKEEMSATINHNDLDVDNTEKYNPDLPMTRIKKSLVTSYKLTMLSKLNVAQHTGKVKEIGHRLYNKARFSSPTIYDCYQEIDPENSDDVDKFYATGPLYVGSSFNDRTLLNHCREQ